MTSVQHRSLALLALLTLSACPAPEQGNVFLGVQLVTDLRAADEFLFVDLSVDAAPAVTRKVSATDDFSSPVRVVDFPALSPRRNRRLAVRLRDQDGREVLAREVAFDHLAPMTRTVTLARSCIGVRCRPDTSCFAGQCADLRCADGSESECRDAECQLASDCAAPGACQSVSCRLGACLFVHDPLCVDGAPDAGTRDGGADVDAGERDAGKGGGEPCESGPCVLDAACASLDFGPSRYWFCGYRRPYQEAAAYCASGGARLAKITSAEENAAIAQRIATLVGATGQNGAHYIGLNDRGKRLAYRWQDNSPLVYESWQANEPSNSPRTACTQEDCVVMYVAGKWNDVCCASRQAFVCEWSAP